MQDLVKWSLKDENRAIQDALTQVGELFSVWTEVQRDFSEHIKNFKNQFDMILEGAKQLDMAKADLQTAEIKEGKLKKELKKAAKKATTEELREMSVKLSEAESTWVEGRRRSCLSSQKPEMLGCSTSFLLLSSLFFHKLPTEFTQC